MVMGAIFATWVAAGSDPAVVCCPLEMAAAGWRGTVGLLRACSRRARRARDFQRVALNNLANIFASTCFGRGQPGGQATRVSRKRCCCPQLEFRVICGAGRGRGGLRDRGDGPARTLWGLVVERRWARRPLGVAVGVPTQRNALLRWRLRLLAGAPDRSGCCIPTATCDRWSAAGSGSWGAGRASHGNRALGALVAFFFAAIMVGSTRLNIALQLDQSLAGVVQGILVLVFILANGISARLRARRQAPAAEAASTPPKEAAHG